jgi:hypothetical protein
MDPLSPVGSLSCNVPVIPNALIDTDKGGFLPAEQPSEFMHSVLCALRMIFPFASRPPDTVYLAPAKD